MRSMVIQMNDQHLQTLALAQLRVFLDGTTAVDFVLAAEERYGFIRRTVRRFTYRHLKRVAKAVVLRFLERVSGYSRQQLTRLVKRGVERAPLIKRYRGSLGYLNSANACVHSLRKKPGIHQSMHSGSIARAASTLPMSAVSQPN